MFEINLVPDVKAEMIRAQKKRNVVFFMSAVVSAIAAGLVVVLLGVKVGQDVRINGQDSQLKQMSDKIESYEGLSELLTVQKQLSDLQTISENKKMLSRVFTVLYSIVHSTRNGDTVNISTLDVNLETSDLDFDGQANAGAQTDGVDFRVLESFKKTIELMKYDYGRYVDKDGNEIPTMCIFEANTNGSPYTDDNGNIYAIWAKGVNGCDPSKTTDDSSSSSSDSDDSGSSTGSTSSLQLANIDLSQGCSGEGLTCIYRTPQKRWYESEGSYMSDDGTISNIEHFESRCITYSVTEDRRLTSENSCDMSPDGLEVISSTNGKAAGGELVLMFSAVLHVNPEVFSFANKHMITITPSGRQNVTDSYMQVGDMFTEKAKAIGTEN
ncbi:hypothetical protein IJG96_01125 [Candidatus Saccharibacteria bacterium]|nr:hypothetical protein [Candidatus Saccharibacteria bacterium]